MCDTFEQRYKFSLYFGGDEGMPVQALGKQLIEFNTLMNIAVAGEYKCDIKVVGARNGSLEIDLAALATIAATFLTPDNVEYIKTSLETIKEWFKVMLHLKGEKPSSVSEQADSVVIKNNEGTALNVSTKGAKILNNCNIQTAILNIGSILSDNERSSFKLKDEDGKDMLEINHDGIELISKPIPNLYEVKRQHSESKVILAVAKPVFIGKAKWEFYINKKSIAATIEDEKWLKDFQNGKIHLFAGIEFEVLLHTEYQLDDIGAPIPNTEKYTVKKIYKILNKEHKQIEFE